MSVMWMKRRQERTSLVVQTRSEIKRDCEAGGKRRQQIRKGNGAIRECLRPHSLSPSIAAVIQRSWSRWGKKRWESDEGEQTNE